MKNINKLSLNEIKAAVQVIQMMDVKSFEEITFNNILVVNNIMKKAGESCELEANFSEVSWTLENAFEHPIFMVDTDIEDEQDLLDYLENVDYFYLSDINVFDTLDTSERIQFYLDNQGNPMHIMSLIGEVDGVWRLFDDRQETWNMSISDIVLTIQDHLVDCIRDNIEVNEFSSSIIELVRFFHNDYDFETFKGVDAVDLAKQAIIAIQE